MQHWHYWLVKVLLKKPRSIHDTLHNRTSGAAISYQSYSSLEVPQRKWKTQISILGKGTHIYILLGFITLTISTRFYWNIFHTLFQEPFKINETGVFTGFTGCFALWNFSTLGLLMSLFFDIGWLSSFTNMQVFTFQPVFWLKVHPLYLICSWILALISILNLFSFALLLNIMLSPCTAPLDTALILC